MLEALLNELQDFHRDNQKSHGQGRGQAIQDQAQYACAFARKNGILEEAPYSFGEFKADTESGSTSLVRGAEHVVELDEFSHRIKKFTLPSGFGLTPKLLHHVQAHADLRPELQSTKPSIEFVPATPLEYLTRWQACNDLFHDDVKLTTVILWSDQRVSFGITQPQYAGNIPSNTRIEEYFSQTMWTRVSNELGHTVFYNYAYDILALDIEPRNCYLSENDDLLPFDIILSTPDDELREFLKI